MAIESSEQTLTAKLARWKTRLSDLPSLALPTDYPRSTETSKLVEATHSTTLNDRLSLGLARLALYDDSEEQGAAQDDDGQDDPSPSSITNTTNAPATPFHIVLSAFVVLLHRYTGDTDLLIATSSVTSKAGDPLLLRIKVDPNDSFWELVRRIQFLEKEAENDTRKGRRYRSFIQS
jgi:L-aminoadipate-semialdehyde dehydrogenase